MPNYRRYFLPGHPVFLTLVAHDRRPWLADDACVQTVFCSMRWAKTKYPFHHLAHAILHDHLHWMLRTDDGTDFSALVAAMKRDVAWRLKETGLKGPFWQNRFYDHVVRDEEDFGRHLDYIHYNPIKHGYVTYALDYPRSSFKEWFKRGVYPENWGAAQPESIIGMDLE